MPRWPNKTVLERFEEKYIPEPNSGCWLWLAMTNGFGYGQFKLSTNERVVAHRFSYQVYKGEIPEGKELDHLCRVRCCVNPDHLEPVFHAENCFRTSLGPVIKNWKKNTCAKGHKFVCVGSRKRQRFCLVCERDRGREFRTRNCIDA